VEGLAQVRVDNRKRQKNRLIMTPLKGFQSVRKMLCLGAHSDDIEIGCGATILYLQKLNPDLKIRWVCFSGMDTEREVEAEASARAFAPSATFECMSFPDRFFPSHHVQIKQSMEVLKDFSPDLIFTHSREDRHQDHRVINEITWNAFRSHQILEYEIPKWDGDLQQTNLYVRIDSELLSQKIRLLMTHFGSQRSKHWFDEETFRSLARIRGLECNARYAEAFIVRKLVLE
jgi:LmbE family N-acetylglucosaminyl deacetylase